MTMRTVSRTGGLALLTLCQGLPEFLASLLECWQLAAAALRSVSWALSTAITRISSLLQDTRLVENPS